jgi:hypothetical protein
MANKTLPLQFELIKFRTPNAPPGVTNYPAAALYLGKLSEVRLASPSDPRPALPPEKSLYVLDSRFQDHHARLEAIHYRVTNQMWPVDASDPKFRDMLVTQAQQKLREDRVRRILGFAKANIVAICTVLIGAALTVAFLCLRQRD